MSESDIIDNWIANGGADEWASNNGYIHKDVLKDKLEEIRQYCMDDLMMATDIEERVGAQVYIKALHDIGKEFDIEIKELDD